MPSAGLAVGEPAETMYEILEAVEPYAPKEKPRYLMGVGTPINIHRRAWLGELTCLTAYLPARNARHGKLYTWHGTLNIKNEKYKTGPIVPSTQTCQCPVCRTFSRAYLRHLFTAGEMLAMRLAVLHNLYFYNDLMAKIRLALEEEQFSAFYKTYKEQLNQRL